MSAPEKEDTHTHTHTHTHTLARKSKPLLHPPPFARSASATTLSHYCPRAGTRGAQPPTAPTRGGVVVCVPARFTQPFLFFLFFPLCCCCCCCCSALVASLSPSAPPCPRLAARLPSCAGVARAQTRSNTRNTCSLRPSPAGHRYPGDDRTSANSRDSPTAACFGCPLLSHAHTHTRLKHALIGFLWPGRHLHRLFAQALFFLCRCARLALALSRREGREARAASI